MGQGIATLSGFLRENIRWLLAGFLLTFASSFGQTFFIAVFAGEIRAEFGLSHGAWGSLYAAATMSSAAVMVFAGGLTDRFRVRHIGVVILFLMACAALTMSQVSALWGLAITLFLLRLFGQGLLGHMAMVGMARWFVATRGRAVSIASLGVATGEALLPISFVLLLGAFDWRMLWVIGAMALMLLAPVIYGLLQRERTPQSFASDAGTLGMEGRNWTRPQVARHWLFWAMIPAMMGPAAWGTAFFFHQVHLAEAKGWAHLSLVSVFPVYTATSIVFMVFAGWLVDRFGCATLARFYLLPCALGFAILGVSDTLLIASAGIVMMGMTGGMNATMSSTLWAEYFGTRNLGSIRAMATAIMVLGTGIGPSVSGLLIDAGLDFGEQSLMIAAYFAVAATLAGIATHKARRLLPPRAAQAASAR
ncbi:MFS transporter [Roseicitreum antarcticum]|nr:MFS transporter [Roseicitreum antarcticum]